MKFTSLQIAKLLQGKLEGDKNVELNTFQKLRMPNQILYHFWQILSMNRIYTTLKQVLY